MYGYYAQGVSIATAVLPTGWQDRVVPFLRSDAHPSEAVCLDPHDLVIAKLVAGREKDLSFASALLREELIHEATLHERADLILRPGAVKERIHGLIRRCSKKPSP